MPRKELGSDNGSAPKTPTLIQFHKQTNGKLPQISWVRIVFIPGKVPNYTLVTAHDFRVNIHKGSSLFDLLNRELAQWVEQGLALAVQPDQENIGKFGLLLDNDVDCGWETREWGYTCSIEPSKTAADKVTRK